MVVEREIKEIDFAGRKAVVVTDYVQISAIVLVSSVSTHVHVSENVIVSENELYDVFISVYDPKEESVLFLPLYDMELNEAVETASLFDRNNAMKLFVKKHWNDEYFWYNKVDALEFFAEGYEPFTFFEN
jgi:hypothetical protein